MIDQSQDPKEVFVYNNDLYISYYYSGVYFFLSGHLPKEGKTNKKYKYLDVEVVKKLETEIPASQKREVVLVKGVLERVVKEVSNELAPRKAGNGYLLLTDYKDVVVYRDFNGKIVIAAPGDIPKEIEMVKKVKNTVIRELAQKHFLSILKAEYPNKRRLLVEVSQIPQVPYLFLDMKTGYMAAVRIPDLYELQKDVSPVGISVGMVYSFFIKSNFIGIIKAPVTSAHIVLAGSDAFIKNIFSPKVRNLKTDFVPLYEGDEMMDLESFNKFLDRNTRKEIYKARTTLLIGGEEFFAHFIKAAGNARSSIDIRLYIFKVDPYSLSLADILKNKSNEGVETRVLVDEINTVINLMKAPKMPHEPDYVMPKIKKYMTEDSSVKFRTHPNILGIVDHTKVIIIDDKLAYTGGMNFGEEYRYKWHDLMIALEGPIVQKLKNNFNHSWTFSGLGGDLGTGAVIANEECDECFKNNYDTDMIDVRPLYTKPSRPDILKAQLEAIKRSKKRIYIQNAYFSDNRIVKELIMARRRGVDVRVILPSENDIGLMHSNNKVKANIMLRNNIRVYFYPTMSHIKAAIYDNWACIGSANFDKLSLFVNGEMNFGIDDAAFVQELNERLFEKDFADSEEIIEPFELTTADYILAALSLQA